jgi:hypothetical protein
MTGILDPSFITEDSQTSSLLYLAAKLEDTSSSLAFVLYERELESREQVVDLHELVTMCRERAHDSYRD